MAHRRFVVKSTGEINSLSLDSQRTRPPTGGALPWIDAEESSTPRETITLPTLTRAKVIHRPKPAPEPPPAKEWSGKWLYFIGALVLLAWVFAVGALFGLGSILRDRTLTEIETRTSRYDQIQLEQLGTPPAPVPHVAEKPKAPAPPVAPTVLNRPAETKPKPAPEPPAPSGQWFTVQMAPMNAEDANRTVQTLQSSGFDASFYEIDLQGTRYFRVKVDRFKNKTEALKTWDKLTVKGYKDIYISNTNE